MRCGSIISKYTFTLIYIIYLYCNITATKCTVLLTNGRGVDFTSRILLLVVVRYRGAICNTCSIHYVADCYIMVYVHS